MFNPLAALMKFASLKLSNDEIAELLKTTPEALEAFERTYQTEVLGNESQSDNFFDLNSRMMSELSKQDSSSVDVSDIINRIVNEFLSEVFVYKYRRGVGQCFTSPSGLTDKEHAVTREDINALPQEIRPQATSYFQKRDIGAPSFDTLLYNLREYLNEKNDPGKRKMFYHLFRQGLDILDLDPVTYEMLSMNRNNMGFWLPKIAPHVEKAGFFKIPDTTIMKVPMNMLQLTRCDYSELTRTTLDIVDKVCFKAFELDESKDYFIKTGTYSSKFDFRNAYVHGGKEVRELGEYLLFIQHQASQMAAPLSKPSIYGVSTTNEFVVREFIHDTEGNPTIYKGLPLHTEYRVFIDFDTREVLGMTPYWEPGTMKKRFGEGADHSVHDLHDYAVYKAHEDTLMGRYEAHRGEIRSEVQKLLNTYNGGLNGQWSVDIMQNGEDFWLIDMALAENSALYDLCVPLKLRRPAQENWIPEIPKTGA